MTENILLIREAKITDISALTELMVELGYNTTESEMETRLQIIGNHQDYKTFIALVDDQVAGIAGLAKGYSYEQNGIYVRVLALVTNHKFRRNGIGKALMEKAENWGREIGATKILLNCGNREERTIGHIFYEALGYRIKSSGYIKNL